jgi:uncharacterized protein (TIGR03083 family)
VVDFVREIERHSDALRQAAAAAGPHAAVPTCPEWTVNRLVGHLATVHGMALRGLDAEPGPDRPPIARPPTVDWAGLLAWFDDLRGKLVAKLAATDPDTPCWTFTAAGPHTAAFWSRRMAHETAIHRLDGEHALAGSTEPPGLLFDPEFAADGVDEQLTVMLPVMTKRRPEQLDRQATALWHAADAGRAWLVTVAPGAYTATEHPHSDGLHEDLTVAGGADAVYRKVWGRPSTALVSGDPTVLSALRGN